MLATVAQVAVLSPEAVGGWISAVVATFETCASLWGMWEHVGIGARDLVSVDALQVLLLQMSLDQLWTWMSP